MDRTVQDILAKTLENLGEKGFQHFKALLRDWTVKSGYYTIPRSRLKQSNDKDELAQLIIFYYKADYGIELARDLLHALNEEKAGDYVYAEVKRVTGAGSEPAGPVKVTVAGSEPARPVIVTSAGSEPARPVRVTGTKSLHVRPVQVTGAGSEPAGPVKVTGTGGQPVRPTRVPGPRPQPVGPVIDGEHFVEKHRADLISRMSPVDPVLDDLLDQKLLTDEQYDTVRSKATSQEKMRQLYDYVRSWGRPDKDKLLQALKKHNGPLIRALEQSYGR
ncbi:apoptosis-associated speck-like protein containing a CARD isoform X1 [Ascaphus truei]|uniref:apoptosis-associated speck-like protein containing a CARD isoform X1 n=1 Tax=Ascaphus truei TaxID=8439 RepID=UPI003F598A24